jgi:hypothetical protein
MTADVARYHAQLGYEMGYAVEAPWTLVRVFSERFSCGHIFFVSGVQHRHLIRREHDLAPGRVRS